MKHKGGIAALALLLACLARRAAQLDSAVLALEEAVGLHAWPRYVRWRLTWRYEPARELAAEMARPLCDGSLLDPQLARALCRGEAEDLRALATKEASLVFSLPLLSARACELIDAELRRFERVMAGRVAEQVWMDVDAALSSPQPLAVDVR